MTVAEWFEQNAKDTNSYSEAIAVRPDGTEIGCWEGDEYISWNMWKVIKVNDNVVRLVLDVPEGR